MTVKKKRDWVDEATFDQTGIWKGKSSAARTKGVHAVSDMQMTGHNAGARAAACGLVGRFLVDPPLTGPDKWSDVDYDQRCEGCHDALMGGNS